MRKLGGFIITTLLCTTTVLAAPIKIQINGTEIQPKVAPIVREGTTLVPLRVIIESLGADVEWDSASNLITIYSSQSNLKLMTGSLEMTKTDFASNEDVIIPLNLAPIQVNSTTMVPLRAISEGLGCNINYANNLITINTSSSGSPMTEVSSFNESIKLTLQDDLTTRYGICHTAVGDIVLHFNITVNENKYKYYPCDFEIAVKVDEQSLIQLQELKNISPETATYIKGQLRTHMEQLAYDLMGAYPQAKFWGYYDLSYHKILENSSKLITYYTCTWMNYSPDANLTYAGSKKGLFSWFPSYDTEIWQK